MTAREAEPGAAGEEMPLTLNLPREGVDYLRRLRAGLAPLPESEREEIVRETASHLLDRLEAAPPAAAGMALAEALARLGEPEGYARCFVTNYRISAALASGSPLAPVVQVLRMIGDGLRGFAVAFLLLVLWCFAFGFLATAVMKPILPGQTGLFVGGAAGGMSLGILGPESRAGARELLGWWVIPIGLALASLFALAAGWVARRFLRAARR